VVEGIARYALANWLWDWKEHSAVTSRSARELDGLDWGILRALQGDARLSYNALARLVGLSAPAVAERVRRMEEAGIIVGYRAEVDPAKVGLSVTAVIRMRCAPGKCLLKTRSAEDFPEILEVLRVSGSHCTVLKVVAADIAHLEAVIERLGTHGEMETSMVWSSALSRRVIDWAGGVPAHDAAAKWR
jgi:Lrp/AsnC family leucine-responsive transcriptional regulator